jgi:alpha-galactosidase
MPNQQGPHVGKKYYWLVAALGLLATSFCGTQAEPQAKSPQVFALAAEPEPALASGTAPQPAIHGPRVVGGTPGKPFLFKIPATGEEPLRFHATHLPAGLSLDESTGILSGSLHDAGSTDVQLQVSGPKGTATRSLTIVAGEHKLALTPPWVGIHGMSGEGRSMMRRFARQPTGW